MRVVIVAPGSRGDVEPYIALGKGLKKTGHVVRLVTHQNFEELVNSHGLEFWPVESNVQDIAQSKEMRGLLERGNFLAIMSQMAKEAERGAIHLAEGGLAACQGMDLVLAGIGGLFVKKPLISSCRPLPELNNGPYCSLAGAVCTRQICRTPFLCWTPSPFLGFSRGSRPLYITVELEQQPPVSGQGFLPL